MGLIFHRKHHTGLFAKGLALFFGIITEIQAQQIEQVAASFDLNPEEAQATIRYDLDSLSSTLPFKLLLIDDQEITALNFLADEGAQLEYETDKRDGPLLSGTLYLPNHLRRDVSLEAHYKVSNRGQDYSLPVLLFEAAPPGVSDQSFTARIGYPSGYVPEKKFPLVNWTVGQQEATFEMQVIPSVIKMALVAEDAASLSLNTVIDMVVVLLLIVLSWIGWRELKSINQ